MTTVVSELSFHIQTQGFWNYGTEQCIIESSTTNSPEPNDWRQNDWARKNKYANSPRKHCIHLSTLYKPFGLPLNTKQQITVVFTCVTQKCIGPILGGQKFEATDLSLTSFHATLDLSMPQFSFIRCFHRAAIFPCKNRYRKEKRRPFWYLRFVPYLLYLLLGLSSYQFPFLFSFRITVSS